MRSQRAVMICLLAGVVLWQFRPARGRANEAPSVKLEFAARPLKTQFGLGETVQFEFSIRNVGESVVFAARPFLLHQYVWLRILSPKGKEVPWCGKINGRIFAPDEFAILQPGASLTSTVRISCDAHKDSGFEFNHPGKYQIAAYYRLPLPKKSLQRLAGNAAFTTRRIRAAPVVITISGEKE